MLVGEWVILCVAVVTIIFFMIVIIRESVKNQKSAKDSNEYKETLFCYEGVAISKKGMWSRSEGLHLPKTIIQYCCLFLLKNGEEKLYLLPEDIFKQLKEGDRGNLYIKNNAFFDFEEIE